MFRTILSRITTIQTENGGVVALRKQAKIRGFSTRENRATSMSKMQNNVKKKTLGATIPRDLGVLTGARAISTTPAGTSEGIIPGIPPASQSTRPPPTVFINTNIPDIPQLNQDLSIQIPYVPDFWDSSSLDKGLAIEEPLPKLLVVAGAETHPNGGPSHNLHDENASIENIKTTGPGVTPKEDGGLWDDIMDDLGLPPAKQMRGVFQKLFS